MTQQPEMIRRKHAVEATQARFAGKPFAWGRVDCAQLAAAHLQHFGWAVPKVARYRTKAQARARLQALGTPTMADLADSIGMVRIAPAAALLGDLCFLNGNGPMGALAIALGNGALLSFDSQHEGLVVIKHEPPLAAWRAVRDGEPG